MTETMLVRTAAGAWERLQPQTTVPAGGITELLGQDIGPVLGHAMPLVVVASSPKLPTGKPDAICVDAEGNITVVELAFTGDGGGTLPSLLSFAGALHGMGLDDFVELCNQVRPEHESLAAFVAEHAPHPDFHRATFEVTIADALAQGRFSLVSVVNRAPSTLTQSMRYLNASGASVSLYEASSFASESVMAVQARAVDVGFVARQTQMTMSAAGMFAVTERTQDEHTAKLMGQLQNFCAATFDDVSYDGDSTKATMSAALQLGEQRVMMVSAASDGSVSVSFEALAPVDKNWSVRADLCEGMNRMLGADLGDVKKISQLNLNIREHLMDDTLMQAFCEILADTVETVRTSAARIAARNGSLAAA